MINENEITKEEQKERPCCGIPLQFTKCTVWPRNVADFFFDLKFFFEEGSEKNIKSQFYRIKTKFSQPNLEFRFFKPSIRHPPNSFSRVTTYRAC